MSAGEKDRVMWSFGGCGAYENIWTALFRGAGTVVTCTVGETRYGPAEVGPVIHELGCDWAERALWGSHLATQEPPDQQCLRVIEVKRQWLRGRATDQELAAARFDALDVVGAAGDEDAHAASVRGANDAADRDARRIFGVSGRTAETASRTAVGCAARTAVWVAARGQLYAELEARIRGALGIREGDPS